MTSITTHKVTRIAHCDMCGKKMRTTRALESTVRCQPCRRQAPLVTPRQRGQKRQWREVDCPRCGVHFRTDLADKIYCTKKCSRRAAEQHPTCSDCGTTLGDRRATRCTPCASRRNHGWNGGKELILLPKVKHERAWPSRALPLRPASFKARTCQVCAQPFIAYGELSLSATCSTDCAREHTKALHDAAKARRKQRQRATSVERIYRRKVYDQDRYACYLCKEPLAMTEQVPHPRAPTIEHLTPLSRGGTHTYDNLRAACFECNWRKGAMTLEEFLTTTN